MKVAEIEEFLGGFRQPIYRGMGATTRSASHWGSASMSSPRLLAAILAS
jgi:hypothetical protein